MQVTTNGLYNDTVLWLGIILDKFFSNELIDNSPQRALNIYNLEGKILAKPTNNQIILIEHEKRDNKKKNLLRIRMPTKNTSLCYEMWYFKRIY